MKTIFEKEYDGESICDVERDMLEVFNPEYNDEINDIPTDEHGFTLGTFKITITWDE